jgi:hypothetical protein
MATALTLSPKRLWLILRALDDRIAAEEARYEREDSGEDADGDFGNDLWNLKLQRDEFAALQDAGSDTATDYQCWFDPEDSGLALLRFQDVQRNRDGGQLSDQAVLHYAFIAHSGEEAMAIHALRQGWALAPTVQRPTIPKATAIAGAADILGDGTPNPDIAVMRSHSPRPLALSLSKGRPYYLSFFVNSKEERTALRHRPVGRQGERGRLGP